MTAQRAIEGQEGQRAARTFTARRTTHRTLRVDKLGGEGYIELGLGTIERTRLALEDALSALYGEPCQVQVERARKGAQQE